MRAIIQRVKKAAVLIEGKEHSSIDSGYLILLGIAMEDQESDMDYIVDKIVNLRIFPDDEGRTNLSIDSKKHEIMVVSQFTLYGDARKGRRPSFSSAAKPETAKKLYNSFIKKLQEGYQGEIKTGVFQEMMDVSLVNDGPFTIMLDSERNF